MWTVPDTVAVEIISCIVRIVVTQPVGGPLCIGSPHRMKNSQVAEKVVARKGVPQRTCVENNRRVVIGNEVVLKSISMRVIQEKTTNVVDDDISLGDGIETVFQQEAEGVIPVSIIENLIFAKNNVIRVHNGHTTNTISEDISEEAVGTTVHIVDSIAQLAEHVLFNDVEIGMIKIDAISDRSDRVSTHHVVFSVVEVDSRSASAEINLGTSPDIISFDNSFTTAF
jgi:hypothetical protein